MIRPMATQDIPFFNEVRNECRNFLHDSSFYTIDDSYDWFNKTKPPFFIYELDGCSIGYFRTNDWCDHGCYVGLDIHKNFRGKKLATKAYEELFIYLKNKIGNRDYYKFYLEVLSHNRIAINLYKKLGFKESSREDIENSNGATYNIKMELILDK